MYMMRYQYVGPWGPALMENRLGPGKAQWKTGWVRGSLGPMGQPMGVFPVP